MFVALKLPFPYSLTFFSPGRNHFQAASKLVFESFWRLFTRFSLETVFGGGSENFLGMLGKFSGPARKIFWASSENSKLHGLCLIYSSSHNWDYTRRDSCRWTLFSLLTKKFLNPSGPPSKCWLGSTLLNFLIDASYSCNWAILSCLKVRVQKIYLPY